MFGIWSFITKRAYADIIPPAYGTLSAVGLCVAAGITVIIISVVGYIGIFSEARLLIISVSFELKILGAAASTSFLPWMTADLAPHELILLLSTDVRKSTSRLILQNR